MASEMTYNISKQMKRKIKWLVHKNPSKIFFRVMDEDGNLVGKTVVTAEQLYKYIMLHNDY